MKVSNEMVQGPCAHMGLQETLTVDIDRLVMKICKSDGHIWSPIRSKFGIKVDYIFIQGQIVLKHADYGDILNFDSVTMKSRSNPGLSIIRRLHRLTV
jgi:hypothetical protein